MISRGRQGLGGFALRARLRPGKALQRIVKASAGYSGKLVHDLRRTGVRNSIRAAAPQSVAMKISGHKDARIFARYNIVGTNDVAEAMRKVSQYEQEKRLARTKKVLEVGKIDTVTSTAGSFGGVNLNPPKQLLH